LILDSIQSENYNNEHEFQTYLYKFFQAVDDGHFRFSPDLLSKELLFRGSIEILSVSTDGVETPEVYTKHTTFTSFKGPILTGLLGDIIPYSGGNWTPSGLIKVDGQ
jgi:hypothetical protein